MPSISLSYFNIALDTFGLIIVLIIFSACLSERITKHKEKNSFLCLLIFVIIALVADIVSWVGEGKPQLHTVTLVSNTVSSCAVQLAIICFMEYLCKSLYENSKATKASLNIFRVLCIASITYSIGNAFFGYSFVVNSSGNYVRSGDITMVILHILFPVLSFFALVLMALFANRSTKKSRVVFIIYTIFPVIGIILDYIFYGLALTYAGIVISIVTIYTNIYLQKQKLIDAQKRALMLSQINPHFVYNTLSTIAAMCDASPKQAKHLTIDFAQYLRKNIDSLTSEELIPFEQEMEHVECYLKIEKARFREKLNIIYSIQCKDFRIPPLTVQPLVENAIKHGITKKATGGTIRILTCEEDAYYIVRIIDDGVGFDSENTDMHVGLQNVRNRIATTCHGDLTVKSTVGIGTRVTILIPKEKGKRK